MLTAFVIILIAIVVAMTWGEGFWSNALAAINAVFAAMIATNLYEGAARFMDERAPSLTYFWDFLMLWLIFAFTMGILRELTERVSPTRVRFKAPVDRGGAALFGFLTGWVVVCFFLFSLHTAPLARQCFGNQFGESPTSNSFYFAPDRLWLGFLQSRSENALSRATPVVFDPQSEFILKYGQRRENFSKMNTMAVDSRNRPGVRRRQQ